MRARIMADSYKQKQRALCPLAGAPNSRNIHGNRAQYRARHCTQCFLGAGGCIATVIPRQQFSYHGNPCSCMRACANLCADARTLGCEGSHQLCSPTLALLLCISRRPPSPGVLSLTHSLCLCLCPHACTCSMFPCPITCFSLLPNPEP